MHLYSVVRRHYLQFYRIHLCLTRDKIQILNQFKNVVGDFINCKFSMAKCEHDSTTYLNIVNKDLLT